MSELVRQFSKQGLDSTTSDLMVAHLADLKREIVELKNQQAAENDPLSSSKPGSSLFPLATFPQNAISPIIDSVCSLNQTLCKMSNDLLHCKSKMADLTAKISALETRSDS